MQRNVETKGNVFVGGARRSWQDIDRDLRSIAKRQRALDAEEAVLLCAAMRSEIWRQLGKCSLLEYLEEVLGYGPKAAKERVRVALALDELPLVADSLAKGRTELFRDQGADARCNREHASRVLRCGAWQERAPGRRDGRRASPRRSPDRSGGPGSEATGGALRDHDGRRCVDRGVVRFDPRRPRRRR